MTRILQLNAATQKQLQRARQIRDTEAERVAATIVADVRKRGDAALFAYTKKFDRAYLDSKSVWVLSKSFALQDSKHLLRAVKHAVKNIHAVAQQQLPKPWSLSVETGVTIRQQVNPIDTIGCYI
ncbi:MAG: histidinol dehydrogenase, partial [Acidobacteria bacterium]|nr:histidinol dehydrogenase [Acidobacteriota bacterium]